MCAPFPDVPLPLEAPCDVSPTRVSHGFPKNARKNIERRKTGCVFATGGSGAEDAELRGGRVGTPFGLRATSSASLKSVLKRRCLVRGARDPRTRARAERARPRQQKPTRRNVSFSRVLSPRRGFRPRNRSRRDPERAGFERGSSEFVPLHARRGERFFLSVRRAFFRPPRRDAHTLTKPPLETRARSTRRHRS